MDRADTQQLDKLERRVGKLESLQNTAGTVTNVTGVAPIASSGGATPAISIAVTTANDGGAVALQAGTGLPGTSQTGGLRVSGSVGADTAFYRAGIAMNNWTVLSKKCRILLDAVSRATGYTNSAVQVSGVTDVTSGWVTLPATIKAVKVDFFVITAAAAGVAAVIENPDDTLGNESFRGTTVQRAAGGNFAYSGPEEIFLSSLGRLRFVYFGTANATTIVIDVTSYMV